MNNDLNQTNPYDQTLSQLESLKAELMSLEYDYLLPQEKESLKGLSFFPAKSIDFFGRYQVINLLTSFQIGITLQSKFYELSIDKNQESDKVTTL